MTGLFLSILTGSARRDKLCALYEAYRQPMYRAAFAVLKEPYLAEDAVHNAFLRLAADPERVGGTDEPRTKGYLIIMARNAAIDIYNQDKKQIPSEEIDDALADVQDVELETESRAVQEEVCRMICALDPAYCDILMLKYYHELEDAEIAQALGISLNLARVRLHRARNKLKQKLREAADREDSILSAKGGDRHD